MRFTDLVGVDQAPLQADVAHREPVETDSYLNQLSDEPRNNGFVTGLVDQRRARRFKATRRGFLRGTVAAVAATTAVSAANLFGPARKVEAQSGVVGTYPRRILQFCPPYNSGDNCQPGCGSSPICTDCCGSDGFFRNDPGRGYTLYAGGCGDGDIADGWLWRFKGTCGSCSEIEYRCSDGYVQTDRGPAPFICRTVTECVPLADGQEAGPDLPDAARSTNWRPAGALELAVDQGRTVSISGWVADGSGVPLKIQILANNVIKHLGTASLARPDIEASRRGAGPNSGFAASFPIDPGTYEFCVEAISGVQQATIGCVQLTVGSGGSARGSGSTGSIQQPSAPTTDTATDTATGAAPAEPTPVPTPTSGVVVLPEPGPASDSPTYGAVQVIRRTNETTGFASGWAGDPDTADPAFINVVVDGVSVASIITDLPRPDVVAAFPSLNDQTGFAVTFPLASDAAEICIVAVSPDDGKRQPLGCHQLTGTTEPATAAPSADTAPTATGSSSSEAVVYGGIDVINLAPNGVEVLGWAFDPNDRDRVIEITAVASGVVGTGSTGEPNEAAQRIYGVDAACGFAVPIELGSGTHRVDLAATNSAGRQIPIGQQSIVIP